LAEKIFAAAFFLARELIFADREENRKNGKN